MGDHGMVGWGMATKITPQGKDYSSVMFYDSYDNLANAMRHLAGDGVMKGLPFDKMEKARMGNETFNESYCGTEAKQ